MTETALRRSASSSIRRILVSRHLSLPQFGLSVRYAQVSPASKCQLVGILRKLRQIVMRGQFYGGEISKL
ncbi:hypothetical protein [Pseudomonas oryzihabitans]|uniref:hypothetical protein n=1 Tax=Pseudomonas oryzihabitans TaxID=47885 RepID=UPI00138E21FB|nr:hypothetical protein [Pseudomonas oryzihabitans]